MYNLHIANKNYSSWSLRPWLLLKTLAIPFLEKLHPFPENGTWELYRAFSPSGKVPCLQDGDVTVWDSLAITEYIAEQHPQVWPKNPVARAWARSACAEMHSGFQSLRAICGMNCGIRIELPELTDDLQKDIARINELWCQGLSSFGGPFLTGDQFTAVDAFFAPVIFRIQTYNLPIFSEAARYQELMLALPAMNEWYSAALQEPWREPGHEREILAEGKLLSDFRELAAN